MTQPVTEIVDDDEFMLVDKHRLARSAYQAYTRDALTFGLAASARPWNKLSSLEKFLWWQAARATLVTFAELKIIKSARKVDDEVREASAEASSAVFGVECGVFTASDGVD